MANELQRSQDGVIILDENDDLFVVPKSVLDAHLFQGSDDVKDQIIENIKKTGRLRGLKAARKIKPGQPSDDVTAFGGAFPDTP